MVGGVGHLWRSCRNWLCSVDAWRGVRDCSLQVLPLTLGLRWLCCRLGGDGPAISSNANSNHSIMYQTITMSILCLTKETIELTLSHKFVLPSVWDCHGLREELGNLSSFNLNGCQVAPTNQNETGHVYCANLNRCLCDFDRIMGIVCILSILFFLCQRNFLQIWTTTHPLTGPWPTSQYSQHFLQVQFHPPNFVGSLGRWWQRRSGRLKATAGASTATADLDLDLMLSPPPGSGLSRYKGPET